VDFPGRTNNFNELQIVANAKKPRGPEDIRRRDTGASRARHQASACCCMSSKETAPTTVTAIIILGSSAAGLRPKEREKDIDKHITTPRRAVEHHRSTDEPR
jgi:hypothetical protein